jgi:hypothetical protein
MSFTNQWQNYLLSHVSAEHRSHFQVATNVEDMDTALSRLSITNGKMFVHVSVIHKYTILLKSYKYYNRITMLACYNCMQHGHRI